MRLQLIDGKTLHQIFVHTTTPSCETNRLFVIVKRNTGSMEKIRFMPLMLHVRYSFYIYPVCFRSLWLMNQLQYLHSFY